LVTAFSGDDRTDLTSQKNSSPPGPLTRKSGVFVAARFSLRDAINAREARQAKDGLQLPLEVAPHHYIRAEK